jgi:hypothetical protein
VLLVVLGFTALLSSAPAAAAEPAPAADPALVGSRDPALAPDLARS